MLYVLSLIIIYTVMYKFLPNKFNQSIIKPPHHCNTLLVFPQGDMSGQVSQVLVTGASGLLGRAVCAVLREKGYAVKGVAFSRLVYPPFQFF